MPVMYNADGSLDIYVPNDSSGKDREPQGLPAPKGPFNLTMRLDALKAEVLTSKWSPPAVR